MAVEFPEQRETSAGPLDINKVATEDNSPVMHTDGTPDLLQDLDGSEDEPETLRQKNPLGYTITEPTEKEIEDAGG